MICVKIQVNDGDYFVKFAVTTDNGVSLEQLGIAVGRAIAGVADSIEYSEGAELIDGLNVHLPDDLVISKNAFKEAE